MTMTGGEDGREPEGDAEDAPRRREKARLE